MQREVDECGAFLCQSKVEAHLLHLDLLLPQYLVSAHNCLTAQVDVSRQNRIQIIPQPIKAVSLGEIDLYFSNFFLFISQTLIA